MNTTLYDPTFIEELIKSVDLLGYAETKYEFKQRGKEYFTHCPFHIDKTPSLAINPEKGTFYCHSCGAGGTIIQWIQKTEELDYNDAVCKAAELIGLEPQKACQSSTVKLNRSLSRQKQGNEPEQHRILDYSEYEKFSKIVPAEWVDEGIPVDTMELFDIRIDTESNRIVYPVRDISGNLINIKGRTRNPEYKKLGVPKYINYYSVGTMDYLQSLDITIPYVRERNELIIFEGIKSVMKAFSFGTRNSASAEKHSLTDEQVKSIIKLGFDVVLAYDSDIDVFHDKTIMDNIKLLRRFTNVYVIEDKNEMLGGAEAKNSPVDCGESIWRQLYDSKRKV